MLPLYGTVLLSKRTRALALWTEPKCLKENCLNAVPFDKGNGFSTLKEDDYFEKLHEVVWGPQFIGIANDENSLAKTETAFSEELQILYNNGKMEKEFDEKSRSCGAQPARLHGFLIVSLGVKSLYTDVPVDESIAQAANLIYRRKNPDFDKNTLVRLMGLAVKKLFFNPEECGITR